MYNVKFIRLLDNTTKYSYTDFGLLLAPVSMDLPQVKTNYVTIPGRNGDLDLSEAFGRVNYNNRTIKLTFTMPVNISDMYSKYSEISNFLHGQKLKVFLPQDEGFYYVGRCQVSGIDRAKRTNQIIITINADPFKYVKEETVIEFDIGDLPYTKVINNLYMPVTPLITTTDSVVFDFNGATYSFNAGQHLNSAIVLTPGENTFIFKDGSSGSVTFEYTEGTL